MLRRHQLHLERINQKVSPNKNQIQSPNFKTQFINPCSMMQSYLSLHRIQKQTEQISNKQNQNNKQQIIKDLQKQIVNKQIKINKMQTTIQNMKNKSKNNGNNFTQTIIDLGLFCVKMSCRMVWSRQETLRMIIKCCQWIKNPSIKGHFSMIHWILRWMHTIFRVLLFKFNG